MMKRVIVLLSVLALLMSANNVSAVSVVSEAGIKILYSADLVGMAEASAEALTEVLGMEVGLVPFSIEDAENWFDEEGNMAFLSKDDLHKIDPQKVRVSVIGREVFVPIMNPANPYREVIMKTGMSPRDFAKAYSGESAVNWSDVLGESLKGKVEAYRVNDPSIMMFLSEFVSIAPTEMKGNVLGSCSEVLSKVKTLPNAIGFCTLNQLMKMEDMGHLTDVSMIPVDLNANEELDHFEEIYGSVDDLSRGIWIGKYTGSLYSRIFAVSSNFPSEREKEILKWMASDGQELLLASGFSALMKTEQQTLLANLNNSDVVIGDKAAAGNSKALILILITLAVLVVFTFFVFRLVNKKVALRSVEVVRRKVRGAHDIPGGYFFDTSHTWTFLEVDGNVRIGVDDFLQHVSGNISKVKMKDAGVQVKKGETILSLTQNGKVIDIKSPLSGVILEVNLDLKKDAGLVNESPYGEAWFYLIEPENWQVEFASFMNAAKYGDWIRTEFERLKDFALKVLKLDQEDRIVLQDGGEPKAGILENFGPEAWEEFQTIFLRNK